MPTVETVNRFSSDPSPKVAGTVACALAAALLLTAATGMAHVAYADQHGGQTTTTTTTTTTTSSTMGAPSCPVVFLLPDAIDIATIQWDIDYATAPGEFVGSDGEVACEPGRVDLIAAFNDKDEQRELTTGLISFGGFTGPQELSRCTFTPTQILLDSDFIVFNVNASDPSFGTIDPPPLIVVDTSACIDVIPTTTTVPFCGDGVPQNDEACDDGNDFNTDSCLNDCTAASCGDGFARAGAEDCDDGNDDNTDACVDECRRAHCGDGFVREGFEDCDDTNTDDSDACVGNCVTARCGDSLVYIGEEECDDGNLVLGDGCSNDCVKDALCGDADGNGDVSATDALRVLKKAVRLDVECPVNVCDVNGSGTILAGDALATLRLAVGADSPQSCPAA